MRKKNYEEPQTELIMVRFEENILSGRNSADEGFNPNNDLGSLGDDDDEG